MGRPRKIVDTQKLEELASIGCTTPEIATILGCSEDTLERRFADVLKRGRAAAKHSLRRLQFASAQGGNIAMQIWLGKQMLGQSDRQQVDVRTDRLDELAEAIAGE